MKRLIASIVLSLALLGSIFAYQNNENTSKKKAPAKTVDCSAVNDAGLTANVKEKLANTPSLKDFAIQVSAKDGTITLTGAVKMGRHKGTATLQTKRVACVRKVDNQLTVESSQTKSAKSNQ